MKKSLYRVKGLVTVGCRVFVEANDEEEAIETAKTARRSVHFARVHVEGNAAAPESFVILPEDLKGIVDVEELTAEKMVVPDIGEDIQDPDVNEPELVSAREMTEACGPPSKAKALEIFIDPKNGSDERDHDGSSRLPLRTFKELIRRGPFKCRLVINLITELPFDDPVGAIETIGGVTIRGARKKQRRK